MLEQYFPILLFILVGLALGAVLLTLGSLLSPSRPDPESVTGFQPKLRLPIATA